MHNVWGKYKDRPSEKLDSATTRPEAMRLLREYAMAFGAGWKIWVGKKADEPK